MTWVSVVKVSPHKVVLAAGDSVAASLKLVEKPHWNAEPSLVALLSGVSLCCELPGDPGLVPVKQKW